MATLSVVFAFVFAPAGAILGHLALNHIAISGQRGRDRAITGATLSYVVLVSAVVALVVWAAGGNDAPTVAAAPATRTPSTSATPTTTSSPAPPPIPVVVPTKAPSLMLTVDELKALVNEPGLAPVWTTEGIAMQPERGAVSDESCSGAFFKGTPTAYAGHEPMRFAGNDIGNSANGHLVGQGVAIYTSAAAAQQAFTAYLDYLRGCVGKSTTVGVMTVTYGAPVDAGGGITTVQSTVVNPGAPDGFWSHAIAVKDNVLVDGIFIGPTPNDDPVKVTQAILDRIPS